MYADPRNVVVIRIFEEPDGTWSIDGIDGGGRYTESCWNFDTRESAVAAADEFQRTAGSSTQRLVVEPTVEDSEPETRGTGAPRRAGEGEVQVRRA